MVERCSHCGRLVSFYRKRFCPEDDLTPRYFSSHFEDASGVSDKLCCGSDTLVCREACNG